VVWGVNVARQNFQATQEYRFDQYYRLEADKAFAENVTRWLADPTIASQILSSAHIQVSDITLKHYTKIFRAERLASNYIQVRFSVNHQSDATKIVAAAKKILADKTTALNSQAEPDQNWFVLVFDNPTIAPHQISGVLLALIGGGGGLLLAIFTVLVIHYWKEDE